MTLGSLPLPPTERTPGLVARQSLKAPCICPRFSLSLTALSQGARGQVTGNNADLLRRWGHAVLSRAPRSQPPELQLWLLHVGRLRRAVTRVVFLLRRLSNDLKRNFYATVVNGKIWITCHK